MLNNIGRFIKRYIKNREKRWIERVSNDGDVRYVLTNDYDDTLYKSAHIQRYLWAKNCFQNKNLFDAGCGSGYGAYWMAEENVSVLGVDISKRAIKFARCRYRRDNLRFMCLDLTKPGIILGCQYNVAISFDVLEHIRETDIYLKNIVQNITTEGILVLGTPNWKMTPIYNSPYTKISEDGRWNPYHFKEFTSDELKELIERYFVSVRILGQRIKDRDIRKKYLEGSGYCPLRSLAIDDEDVENSFGLIAICTRPLLESSGI